MKYIIILALILSSCGNPSSPTVPPPPNSSQTQVLNINNSLSDALRLAITTSISLRDQGVIVASDTRSVQDWSLKVLDIKDKIDKELASSDTWEIQKKKILDSLVGFSLPVVTSNPTLQAILISVQTIVQQIRNQVQ